MWPRQRKPPRLWCRLSAVTDDFIEQRRYRREYERTHAVTTRKVLKWTALTVVAGYLGYCGYRQLRRTQLKKQALTDPNVDFAVRIWNAIPAGCKNDIKPWWFLNPWKGVSVAADKISMLWTDADFDALCTIARSVHSNPNADPQQISSNFYALYGAALPDILTQALGSERYTVFSNIIANGSASSTATVQSTNTNGEALFLVSKTVCNVRETADVVSWDFGFFNTKPLWGDNIIKQVGANVIVGRANGVDQYDEHDGVILTQIVMLRNVNGQLQPDPTQVAWVAKSQIHDTGFTVNEVRNRFGNVNALVIDGNGKPQLQQIV